MDDVLGDIIRNLPYKRQCRNRSTLLLKATCGILVSYGPVDTFLDTNCKEVLLLITTSIGIIVIIMCKIFSVSHLPENFTEYWKRGK